MFSARALNFVILIFGICWYGSFAPCPGAAKCAPPPRRRAPAPPRRRAPVPPRRRAPPATPAPTKATPAPTKATPTPSVVPTLAPTDTPTYRPTLTPTRSATLASPTVSPTVSPTGAPVVSMAMTVSGVDFNSLMDAENAAVRIAFEDGIKAAIVNSASDIAAEHIALVLSAGSVVADATITPPDGVDASTVGSSLEGVQSSGTLATSVVNNLNAIASISAVTAVGASIGATVQTPQVGTPVAPTVSPTVSPSVSPTALYHLVKSDVECGSSDVDMDEKESAQACADAVELVGGQYFVYGKGSLARKCWHEKAASAACPEGFLSAEYDFYQIGASPAPTFAPPTPAPTDSPTGLACVGEFQSPVCYGGVETRVYKISTPATNGGAACPQVDDYVAVETCAAFQHSLDWAYVVPRTEWDAASADSSLPQEIPMVICPLGDRIVFSWTDTMHDVWRLPDEVSYAQCSFEGAEQLHEEKTTGGLVFDCATLGVFHFACSVDNACLNGRQRVRIYVTDPSQTATLRALGHSSLASFVQDFTLTFMGYASDASFTDTAADEAIAASVDLLANSPQACADWLPTGDNSDTYCRAFITTDLGFISRVRPTPDFAAAENYYEEALQMIPGMCGATSYLVELRVQQNDQVRADTQYLAACESCSMNDLDMMSIHKAYQSKGWTPPSCGSTSVAPSQSSLSTTSTELSLSETEESSAVMVGSTGRIVTGIAHLVQIWILGLPTLQ